MSKRNKGAKKGKFTELVITGIDLKKNGKIIVYMTCDYEPITILYDLKKHKTFAENPHLIGGVQFDRCSLFWKPGYSHLISECAIYENGIQI